MLDGKNGFPVYLRDCGYLSKGTNLEHGHDAKVRARRGQVLGGESPVRPRVRVGPVRQQQLHHRLCRGQV